MRRSFASLLAAVACTALVPMPGAADPGRPVALARAVAPGQAASAPKRPAPGPAGRLAPVAAGKPASVGAGRQAPVAGRQVPGRPLVARLGAARFDSSRSAIEIPFTGPPPRVRLFRLTARHYYYDFYGARFGPGGAQHLALGSNVERFTIANRPQAPAVRLSFRVTRATIPAAQVDGVARRIKVLPLGREAALGSVPALVPHGLSLPRDMLVLSHAMAD